VGLAALLGAITSILTLPLLSRFAQQTGPTPVVVQPGAPGQPTRTLPSSTRATLPPQSHADVQFMPGMILHQAKAVGMTALIDFAQFTGSSPTIQEGSGHYKQVLLTVGLLPSFIANSVHTSQVVPRIVLVGPPPPSSEQTHLRTDSTELQRR
jgi:hypothetical protein